MWISIKSNLKSKDLLYYRPHLFREKDKKEESQVNNFKPCNIAATYTGEIKRVHYQMLGHTVARSYWCSKGSKTQCYCGRENSRIWGSKEKSRLFRTTTVG